MHTRQNLDILPFQSSAFDGSLSAVERERNHAGRRVQNPGQTERYCSYHLCAISNFSFRPPYASWGLFYANFLNRTHVICQGISARQLCPPLVSISCSAFNSNSMWRYAPSKDHAHATTGIAQSIARSLESLNICHRLVSSLAALEPAACVELRILLE